MSLFIIHKAGRNYDFYFSHVKNYFPEYLRRNITITNIFLTFAMVNYNKKLKNWFEFLFFFFVVFCLKIAST